MKQNKKINKRDENYKIHALTLIVHAAVLILLAGHEGINLGLGHLLSYKREGPRGQDGGSTPCLLHPIFGRALPLTQGGQHDAQLSAHDGAIALLVEDAQTLNVVVVGSLGQGVHLLQHGQEGFKVQPLVGHV